jgi:hypothetical protein
MPADARYNVNAVKYPPLRGIESFTIMVKVVRSLPARGRESHDSDDSQPFNSWLQAYNRIRVLYHITMAPFSGKFKSHHLQKFYLISWQYRV